MTLLSSRDFLKQEEKRSGELLYDHLSFLISIYFFRAHENLFDPRDPAVMQVFMDPLLQQSLGGFSAIIKSQVSNLLKWLLVFDSFGWPSGAKHRLDKIIVTQKMKEDPT